MSVLLDVNVLVALVLTHSPHHVRATENVSLGRPFATCAVTQGGLLRALMGPFGQLRAEAAWQVLRQLTQMKAHEFWDAGFSYLELDPRRLQGRGQVTDGWLAELARRKQSRLITFDQGLATAHPDVVELVP
jgi:toxin-antitoxin system PIN domain toxin